MIALEPLFEVFEQHFSEHPITNEYAVISDLKKAKVSPFSEFNLSHSKDLFRAHFLTKHALYQLQNHYSDKNSFYLDISLTKIQRLPYSESSALNLINNDETKRYYLDIRHYFETEEDEVNDLLDSFWRKYLARDDKVKALEILSLGASANYAQVKNRYRELAQVHHPDKGGCEERFKEIASAKKLLDTYFRSQVNLTPQPPKPQ